MTIFINEYLRTNLTITFLSYHHFHAISFQIFQIQLLYVFQFHLQLVQQQLPLTHYINVSYNLC